MTNPLIGITGRRWPVTRLGDLMSVAMASFDVDLHISGYSSSVIHAGGLAVTLPHEVDPVAIVARLDGLVLSGGADVNPDRYGEEPHPRLGKVEDTRDEFEFSLLAAARARGIPVLAICRGVQILNVACGGTLRQHVRRTEGSGHPRWDVDGRTTTHGLEVVPGTLLSTLYSSTTEVNSLHHQTLDRVGHGLIINATAPDGVVEAVNVENEDVLGVQWHPEMLQPDPVFSWLVERAIAQRDTRLSREQR
ncbi:MAG: gamma-glutamyl-gamma-aminobutyrate hydrolase family protein [Actinomycetota bacterium]|jgi:putative glutamine amidotransferase